MSDNVSNKNNTPIIIIVVCASISMIVGTISSAIAVMGYDDVIRADAQARVARILQDSKPIDSAAYDARFIELEKQVKLNVAQIELNTELSHESGQ